MWTVRLFEADYEHMFWCLYMPVILFLYFHKVYNVMYQLQYFLHYAIVQHITLHYI